MWTSEIQYFLPTIFKIGLTDLIQAVCISGKSFIDAMEKGQPGSTYLLGHENMTLEAYFKRLEKISAVKGPFLKVPSFLSWGLAALLYKALGVFGKWDPSLDPVVVEMAQHFWYVFHMVNHMDMYFSCHVLETSCTFSPTS